MKELIEWSDLLTKNWLIEVSCSCKYLNLEGYDLEKWPKNALVILGGRVSLPLCDIASGILPCNKARPDVHSELEPVAV
jgi:hypothetical protein